jgi:predicted GH43/DUF377 family glycosyl hydrolase
MFFKRKGPPLITPKPGTYYADALVGIYMYQKNGSWIGYLVGIRDGIESIGYVEWIKNDITSPPDIVHDEPIIVLGKPGTYDSKGICDPAALTLNGLTYLYYGASTPEEDTIALALSRDGVHFYKMQEPVHQGKCPEVIYKDGVFYLYYVRKNEMDGFTMYMARSNDGFHFTGDDNPIITPGKEGDYDDKTVFASRIICVDNVYYMTYCAGSHHGTPKFGMARSFDLCNWEKAKEAVFSVGEPGEYDEWGVWFPTIYERDGIIHLWYEGGRYDEAGKYSASIGYCYGLTSELEKLFS